MILKFLHINGQTFSLDMDDNATIQQTKIALIYIYKLQYHSLEFLFNGRILNDDEIVSKIGFFNGGHITFYEPSHLDDETDEIPPFFGSIPQVCNPSGAPPFDEKDIFSNDEKNKSQDEIISPFQEIERGSDQRYLKYLIEPSLIQDHQSLDSDYNPVLFNDNVFRFNSSKNPTNFQKIYKNSINVLVKPTYPKNEIIQKAKDSVEAYCLENQANNFQENETLQNNFNSFSNTINSNISQNMNTRSFTANIPSYNLYNTSNLSHQSSLNNNNFNNSIISRFDFNHPAYFDQPFQRHPSS